MWLQLSPELALSLCGSHEGEEGSTGPGQTARNTNLGALTEVLGACVGGRGGGLPGQLRFVGHDAPPAHTRAAPSSRLRLPGQAPHLPGTLPPVPTVSLSP